PAPRRHTRVDGSVLKISGFALLGEDKVYLWVLLGPRIELACACGEFVAFWLGILKTKPYDFCLDSYCAQNNRDNNNGISQPIEEDHLCGGVRAGENATPTSCQPIMPNCIFGRDRLRYVSR